MKKISVLIIFLLGLSAACSEQTKNNEKIELPKTASATNVLAVENNAILKGIWTIQSESPFYNNPLLMESVRIKFDGVSKARIYIQKNGQISWFESLYVYSNYPEKFGKKHTLLFYDQTPYRHGTFLVAIVQKSQSNFELQGILSNDSYFPQVITENLRYTMNLVPSNETSPFEIEDRIDKGESVSGERLDKLPSELDSIENLYGTWSLESFTGVGSTTPKIENIENQEYQHFQIRFDADGSGRLFYTEKDQDKEKEFYFVISKYSREIFLCDRYPEWTKFGMGLGSKRNSEIFAKISISDLSTKNMTVKELSATKGFQPTYLGLGDEPKMFGGASLIFSKIP